MAEKNGLNTWVATLPMHCFLLQFKEQDFVLRSMDEHIKQCDLLEEDPHQSIEYGINFRSALMSLQLQFLGTRCDA